MVLNSIFNFGGKVFSQIDMNYYIEYENKFSLPLTFQRSRSMSYNIDVEGGKIDAEVRTHCLLYQCTLQSHPKIHSLQNDCRST